MDIRSFLDELPHGGIKDFAVRCRISEVYLHQLAARQAGRVPSPTLTNVLVRESGGRITHDACRPADWRDIWPDLPAAAKDQAAEPATASAGE